MRQIVILSGKGGTGKTSLTAALAHLAFDANELVLADADVDAANLEILLKPVLLDKHSFEGGFKAEIDTGTCNGCGRCFDVCRYDAVIPPMPNQEPGEHRIDRISCEGCNSCLYQCPVNAISSHRAIAGEWFQSRSLFGPLFHAEMKAGEENSGKLVTIVKNAAIELGERNGCALFIVDGPPGIGCPVIAAAAGADLAVISTEPGVSAIHDLSRILGTVKHFGITPAVCINRSDINPAKTAEIEAFCKNENIILLGRIPYDDSVTFAMSKGMPVTAFAPDSPASAAIREIWKTLSTLP
ncbi:MAG: ATP-binding protein [Candidatus Fermentibacteraceae bacterium]|nr:ATP-binding protein [Candidatus Fermentibacteraceae bacterium]